MYFCEFNLSETNTDEPYELIMLLGQIVSDMDVSEDGVITIHSDDGDYQHKNGFRVGTTKDNRAVIEQTLTLDGDRSEALDMCAKLFLYNLGQISSSPISYKTNSNDVDLATALTISRLKAFIESLNVISVIKDIYNSPVSCALI